MSGDAMTLDVVADRVPPLAIIQARMGSTRLPGKVLLPIGGETLLNRVWRQAVYAFGEAHVVVATPNVHDNAPLWAALATMGAKAFVYDGDEADVLGRFWACAHTYRWHAESVIVRVTPDDWKKDCASMRRVAAGERLPVEQGGEAFTLAALDHAHRTGQAARYREHITHALFEVDAPPAPEGLWTIDTPEDYAAAIAEYGA